MSHGRKSKNGSRPHQMFIWDKKGNFPSNGFMVRNSLYHMEEYPKMDSPHVKSSCRPQNEVSNLMTIGLRIDYVTCRNIQKWMTPTSNLHGGQKIKFAILWT